MDTTCSYDTWLPMISQSSSCMIVVADAAEGLCSAGSDIFLAFLPECDGCDILPDRRNLLLCLQNVLMNV